MSFEMIPVWKQLTPAIEAELVEFWERNHALGEGVRAKDRAAQAACIGRDDEGRVCAAATAALCILPTLRQPTYYYRQFFAVAQRGQRQTVPFMRCAREALKAYNASLPKPESLGLLIELENKLLAARYNRATQGSFNFIGYSPRNLPVFVSWFEGATLLPPAPVRTRDAATQDHRHTNTGTTA